MAYTIEQIATALGARAFGDGDIVITGAAEPADARPDELALAMKPDYAEMLSQGHARAAMLWDGADWQAMGLEAAIVAPRPRFAMAGLTQMLDLGQGWGGGIHPSAVIDPAAHLVRRSSRQASAKLQFCRIAFGAAGSAGSSIDTGDAEDVAKKFIGEDTVIGPQCFVGVDVQIGPAGFLREAVRISARVVIGARFIAQPGAVIGSDGFSFVTPEVSGVEKARKSLGDQGEVTAQSYVRIHSLGSVRIGDDVEIGANSTLDRGTIRDTVIGARTKLDNLVHIGHNCIIGDDCLICGQVGLAGSVNMGNNVVLGGQAGVSDNITIGHNVIAGGGAKLLSNVPDGRVVMGYPATKMDTQMELYKNQRRLKRLFADVAELKKTVSKDGPSD